jgi:hypothetical protein
MNVPLVSSDSQLHKRRNDRTGACRLLLPSKLDLPLQSDSDSGRRATGGSRSLEAALPGKLEKAAKDRRLVPLFFLSLAIW